MKRVKINDIIKLERRIYRVEWSNFSNGKMQGNRAILKLLTTKELMSVILKNKKIERGFKKK